MHVLILPSWYPQTPTDVDGIFFRQQAEALSRAGLQVGVIAPIFRALRSQPETIFSRQYGIENFVHNQVATSVYHSMYFFPRIPYLDRNRWVSAAKKLFANYVSQYGKPDIIHAHCVNHAGIAAHEIHQTTGIPYVITEHSSTYARKLIRDWQRPSMQAAAESASVRLAVSQNFCALLQEEYHGLDWQYLPNILSAPFEAPVDLSTKPHNDIFTFCSIAHLHPKKGFDILLAAFAQALKQRPNMRLIIGGGGLLEHSLPKLASELGISNAVTFTGRLNNTQVLSTMFASDAFVLASHIETFGVVFIEALSQGLPVIATRCGGPENFIHADRGILVPTADIPALADALVKLHDTRHHYPPEQLRENCLAEFGEHAITAQLKAAYQKALKGN